LTIWPPRVCPISRSLYQNVHRNHEKPITQAHTRNAKRNSNSNSILYSLILASLYTTLALSMLKFFCLKFFCSGACQIHHKARDAVCGGVLRRADGFWAEPWEPVLTTGHQNARACSYAARSGAIRPIPVKRQNVCRASDAIRSGSRYAKWAGGSRSQTHRRAAKGGFTQDDGNVRGLAPTHTILSFGSFLLALAAELFQPL
jgi:hypothetical protein